MIRFRSGLLAFGACALALCVLWYWGFWICHRAVETFMISFIVAGLLAFPFGSIIGIHLLIKYGVLRGLKPMPWQRYKTAYGWVTIPLIIVCSLSNVWMVYELTPTAREFEAGGWRGNAAYLESLLNKRDATLTHFKFSRFGTWTEGAFSPNAVGPYLFTAGLLSVDQTNHHE